MDTTLTRSLAHLDDALGRVRALLRDVAPTLEDEIAAMHVRALQGGHYGPQTVIADASAAVRLLDVLDAALAEVAGYTPTAVAARPGATAAELRATREAHDDAQAVAAVLDANAQLPQDLRAAVARRVHAAAIVTRRLRVRQVAARVTALREELRRLRTLGDDSDDLLAPVRRVEAALGHPLPLPEMRWPDSDPLAVPVLDEAAP